MQHLSQAFLFFLIISLVWGALGSSKVTHQHRYNPPMTPEDWGLPWESVSLQSEDKTPLSAWLIEHPNPSGILLLLHGYGACKADLLDVAKALHAAGNYHLFLLDFRAHGASGGSTISFGKRELQDVKAALDYFSSQPQLQNLSVGAYGLSMGGAISLLAAAKFPQIQAVVADSAYGDLTEALAWNHQLQYHLPRFPMGQMVIWGAQLRLGQSLDRLSPVRVVSQLAPRPVLFIHGEADGSIPPVHAKNLYQAALDPKELWLVPKAEHAASYYLAKETYPQKVLEVFDDALQRKT